MSSPCHEHLWKYVNIYENHESLSRDRNSSQLSMAQEKDPLQFWSNFVIWPFSICFIPRIFNLCHVFKSVLEALSSHFSLWCIEEQSSGHIAPLRVVGSFKDLVKSYGLLVPGDLDCNWCRRVFGPFKWGGFHASICQVCPWDFCPKVLASCSQQPEMQRN